MARKEAILRSFKGIACHLCYPLAALPELGTISSKRFPPDRSRPLNRDSGQFRGKRAVWEDGTMSDPHCIWPRCPQSASTGN